MTPKHAWKLVLALAAALLLAGVAGAKTTTDADDSPGSLDIKSVSPSTGKHGKIKFVVKFYENVPSGNSDRNRVGVIIYKKAPAPYYPAHYYSAQGLPKEGFVVEHDTDCYSDCPHSGPLTVTTKGKKMTFVFKRKAIGSPKHKFFWRVHTSYGSGLPCSGVDPPDDCEDFAPDYEAVKQPL